MVKIVELLLADGVDVNAQDHTQQSALHLTAANLSLDVLKLLLESGGSNND